MNKSSLAFSLSLLCTLALSANSANAQYEGEYSPKFSPDGKYVAYHKNGKDISWDVMVKNLDTNEVTQVTQTTKMEVDPAWSPGGSKLVYSSRNDNDWDIYIYNLKRKTAEPLIINPGKDNAPMFSPDGQSVVFISERSGLSQLHRLNLADNQIEQLTDTGRPISHPSFSLDGSYIIFDQYYKNADGKGGRSKIFQLDLQTKQVTQLYANTGSAMSGKRVGNYLYITTNKAGNWDIVKVDLKSKKETPVANEVVNEMKANFSFSPKKQIAYSRFDKNGVSKVVVKALN